MGLSKQSRILILLAIDAAFFLLELIVGYAVHSLALVADSFHMLNDVLSLCVGLWAVKAANEKGASKWYTYGWQRAETLGALVNGVFLVALCLTIFLDAIQRFVEPQEVSAPKFVLIVGCFGLASNILGLVLFHEHGHGHGHDHGDAHASGDEITEAEEGRHDTVVQETDGELPEVGVANGNGQKATHAKSRSINFKTDDSESASRHGRWTRRRSLSRGSRGLGNLDEFSVHPASFRNQIIDAANREEVDSGSGSEEIDEENTVENGTPTETTSLLNKGSSQDRKYHSRHTSADVHKGHKHRQPTDSNKKGGSGHGHSHGDLNMRGVFLHVMGDALGNIGVIASALIIWLTTVPWRFYADPAISLVITVIILYSAIPLCKAASRILLQAVPAHISVDDIKDDILELPGIVSCHHLHVWQLSDTKLIASLHVQVAFPVTDRASSRYMHLARAIRACLHDYGIHSSTIQPEFCLDDSHDHVAEGDAHRPHNGHGHGHDHDQAASDSDEYRCLLDCGAECAKSKQCCAPSEQHPDGG
ncbi:cation efflux protein [Lineolata rhizophorae]|uniref:Cation efflux protein n=1 Tax=Lineolata rhizophorae TaxID=578093 RepID=A0A6A6P6Z6_9PEZI|nr:cation efflux protein [Lineolata rhizophorae]